MWTPFLVLSVSTLFWTLSSSICADKFALSSVDALVHKQRNSRAIILRKENFNLLDNYISIDVIGSNASQLCEGMIKNFPQLETLSFINANLTQIEPGTFQNVPKLAFLSLAVNKLTLIPRGVFEVIRSLKVVYLTNNLIETIEDAAFAEMPNLKSVHLDHNRLKELSGNIFFGSPRLSEVDFSYNDLTTIPRHAFEDLTPGSGVRILKVSLQRNRIDNIEPEALERLKLPITLHLEHNEIGTISGIVVSLREGSTIFFAHNKVGCVTDDVLERVKHTRITVNVENNPVDCQCMENVERILDGGEVRGELNVVTTLPCHVEISPFYGNQY